MHVATYNAGMFPTTINGVESSLDDLFPGFDQSDRLGVVVHSPFGGLGASALIQRCVHEFYRCLPKQGEIYPEYFIISVGGSTGDHSMLDVWPPHRFLTVEDDAERVLQAIVDRGVTRLLVEDRAQMAHEFAHWTKQSAIRSIKNALLFDKSGTVDGGDVQMAHPDTVERYVAAQLDVERIKSEQAEYEWYINYVRSWEDDFTSEEMAALRRARADTITDGYRIETYARVSVESALDRLASVSRPDVSALQP